MWVSFASKHMSIVHFYIRYMSDGVPNNDVQVHGANMGPTWVLSAPEGPHVSPMNLAIRGYSIGSCGYSLIIKTLPLYVADICHHCTCICPDARPSVGTFEYRTEIFPPSFSSYQCFPVIHADQMPSFTVAEEITITLLVLRVLVCTKM